MSRSRLAVRGLAVTAVLSLALTGTAAAAWLVTSSTATAAARAHTLGPVTALGGTSSETSVTLSWTAPTGVPAATYSVTRTTGTPTVVCASTAATTCTDSGRTASTSYAYSVVAERALWRSTAAPVAVTTSTPPPPPPPATSGATSLALTNTTGQVAGKAEKDDTITVVFSAALDTATMCPTVWSGNIDQSRTTNDDVIVTLADGLAGGNDAVTISSVGCGGGSFGSINLGSPNFVTGGNAIFTGNGNGKSTITWTASTKTLKILLGAKTGTGAVATVSTATVATYTPGGLMKTTTGVGVTGTVSTASVVQF